MSSALPGDVRRIAVVGTTGVGKSTLAGQLAGLLGVPHIELDALYWQPDWIASDREDMRRRVRSAVQAEGWVMDGNYNFLSDIVWPRLQAVVWLDYPLSLILWRLLRRTWQRSVSKELIWGTNREDLWKQFGSRDSLFLWALKTCRRNRRRYSELLARPENAGLCACHFTHPGATNDWLERVRADRR